MRRLLITGFSLILFLIMVVGFVGISNLSRVNKVWEKALAQGIAIRQCADDFDIRLLRARHEEKNFLMRYKAMGVKEAKREYLDTKFAKNITEAKEFLKKIKDIEVAAKEMNDVERADKVELLLNAYESQFLKQVDRIEQGGLDDKAVEAAFSESADFVQSALALQELTVKVLAEGNKMLEASVQESTKIEKSADILMVLVTLVILITGVAVSALILRMVSQAIKALENATSSITSSGQEILAASQQQAAAAREQSSAVAETSTAAKELSVSAEEVGKSIRRVAEASSHALVGMAKIKESIARTNQLISALGEKSQKIGKITDLIDDVADRTNLLAVNASIEAARAGEQGRGFTVVADEIRKLSDSTAKSTKDITALIELIQHEMTNSIMSMEQSVSSVDQEARAAQETADNAKEIAMSASQQISGSKQIADAMLNIDEAMKQVSAGAQQSQVAVKQLTGLASELKELTGRLK